VPASAILLLEADAASGELVGSVLTRLGYAVTTESDPDDALALVAENQLVIVGVVKGRKSSLDVVREIRATPAAVKAPILCISQTDEVEDRIRFLEAGADDVMAKPFDGRELEARVEALLLRFQRSKDLAPALPLNGTMLPKLHRVVAVFSPKGGVGTTTIATNIATSQAQRRPDKVVLLDLNLQFGSVASHLNLDARHTLADIIRDEAALAEPELLRTYATRHDSGLHVIPSPPTPELGELVEPSHVEQLLEAVLAQYDAVVIDAGSLLDERTLVVFEHADTVILPVNPEIAALKAVSSLLEYLSETSSVGSKTTFVLNNMFAREILRLRDVERALGMRVSLELPYDPFLYLKAVNEGIPVVRGAPRSAAAERLVKLSTSAFNEDGHASVPVEPERRQTRRMGLLRRQ